MSGRHATPQELSQLVDGELRENEAGALRAHLATCVPCRVELEEARTLVTLLAAPLDAPPSADALAALERRVDAAERGRLAETSHGRARRLGAIAALGLGAAAAVALVVLLPRGDKGEGHFAARGEPVAWSARVGADLVLVATPPRRPAPGQAVDAGATYTCTYRNLTSEAAYLLAFAVDSAGDVHWLFPAYQAAGTDPASVRLEPQAGEGVLPEAGSLDRPAPGLLRWILVITQAPLQVSAVETLPKGELNRARLRERWPAAAVTTLDLQVGSTGRAP